MANEIATTTKESRVTQELLLDYLKTMNKGLTEQQTKQFLAVAGTFGLDPWKREVYAVTFKNKDGSTEMSIVTGYETYIKRAELNSNYDGYDIEFKGSFKKGKVTNQGKNGSWQVDALVPVGEVSCVCKVYRKDKSHPVVEEVFFDEYDQGNSMWQSKPRTMLKKVAIVSAFRKAFPFDFGGMPYTNDELPDHMTGADKLQQQGLQEVPTEAQQQPQIPQQTEDDPHKKAEFVKSMAQLKATHNEVYEAIMTSFGYCTAADVEPEKRREVFKVIQAEIAKEAV